LPNNLEDIHFNAFNGIEARIRSLNLRDSNLVHVPAALSRLHNLQALDLSGNPIQTVSYSDFNGFANILQLLSISLNHMPAYPNDIDKLPVLRVLNLYDISFEMNDMSIFRGSSISTLKLTFTPGYNGPILPPSIVNLSGLRSVYVNGRRIPCDCSLKYLQDWDVSKLRIHSQCTTGEYRVLEYIRGDLQRC
jgi:Leucine-rich repeat (LRR) protein